MPDQRKPVSIINRRTRMLSKMVENLMAILETQTQRAAPEKVDLADLLRELLADYRLIAQREGLRLEVQVPSALPPILGHTPHLYQVLDNLLANAVKFTPPGGRISVRGWEAAGQVMVSVSDTGVGIPEDEVGRIFDRFYQVDGSMSRRYGGAGLGLALVKEIVEAHGGQVRVQSRLGQGSCFELALPVAAR